MTRYSILVRLLVVCVLGIYDWGPLSTANAAPTSENFVGNVFVGTFTLGNRLPGDHMTHTQSVYSFAPSATEVRVKDNETITFISLEIQRPTEGVLHSSLIEGGPGHSLAKFLLESEEEISVRIVAWVRPKSRLEGEHVPVVTTSKPLAQFIGNFTLGDPEPSGYEDASCYTEMRYPGEISSKTAAHVITTIRLEDNTPEPIWVKSTILEGGIGYSRINIKLETNATFTGCMRIWSKFKNLVDPAIIQQETPVSFQPQVLAKFEGNFTLGKRLPKDFMGYQSDQLLGGPSFVKVAPLEEGNEITFIQIEDRSPIQGILRSKIVEGGPGFDRVKIKLESPGDMDVLATTWTRLKRKDEIVKEDDAGKCSWGNLMNCMKGWLG